MLEGCSRNCTFNESSVQALELILFSLESARITRDRSVYSANSLALTTFLSKSVFQNYKINKQNRNRVLENIQLSEGRGLQGWVKKVKGLSKKTNKQTKNPFIHTDYSMVITTGERGMEGGRRGDRRRLGLA